jgi:phosphatidylglycerol lysyltransferase
MSAMAIVPVISDARLGEGWLRAHRRWLIALVPALLAAIALAVLHRELGAYHVRDIARRIGALPSSSVITAILLTAVDYSVLVVCDLLALRYAQRRLPLRRVALASSVGYGVSHLLSYSALTGGSVRYRFWSAWGLTAPEIAQGVGFLVLTNLLGIIATSGVALAIHAGTLPLPLALSANALRGLGLGLLLLVLAYVGWSIVVRRPLGVAGRELRPPGPALAMAQVGISAADWALAGAVLYALLPPAQGLSFALFLGAFLLAQAIGILSYVPGGIGVFDTVIILLLRPYVPVADALGALVAYRGIYYFLPFAAAVTTLGTYEIRHRQGRVWRIVAATQRSLSALAPDLLSGAAFLAGVILLVSGAMPAIQSRLGWLNAIVPLGVIELSHFVGSLAGVGLLILALGLRRRLDVAYHLTVVALAVGAVASLLKGADWEEACILAGVLAVLVPSRRHFYRRASLTSEPWSLGWGLAFAAVLGGTVWLGFFAQRHLAYSDDLWWTFTLHGDAPRFLRASVGAIGLAVALALSRLFRPARPRHSPPSGEEIEHAARIARESGRADTNLATLGDKALLFGESGGLLMYAVSGRSWVSFGDPIGSPQEQTELAWRFKELADRHGGRPVFYEVGSAHLPIYLELGLSLFKIGEEARVPLDDFSLEGSDRRGVRRALGMVERKGGAFEIVPPHEVPALLPELERVSTAWLASKHTREKGFSLGFFDETYIARFPVAVVRCEGRVVAFANVWLASAREEISVDLMRHESDAPHGVMEFLFVHLMMWGKEQGYRWFNMGMAPLSGFQRRALAPLWSRIGAVLYRHGEHFYNFQGLRQYKGKFDPVWEPKYVACPGGLALPRVLLNVAALISGGWRGVIAR